MLWGELSCNLCLFPCSFDTMRRLSLWHLFCSEDEIFLWDFPSPKNTACSNSSSIVLGSWMKRNHWTLSLWIYFQFESKFSQSLSIKWVNWCKFSNSRHSEAYESSRKIDDQPHPSPSLPPKKETKKKTRTRVNEDWVIKYYILIME